MEKAHACVRKPPQAMRATVLPERSVVMRKAFPVLLTVSIRAEVSSFFPSCMQEIASCRMHHTHPDLILYGTNAALLLPACAQTSIGPTQYQAPIDKKARAWFLAIGRGCTNAQTSRALWPEYRVPGSRPMGAACMHAS